MTSAVLPSNLSYLNRVPYITSAEFQSAGTGVSVNQLVPGGDAAAQAAALTTVIRRATSWVDQLVYGAYGTMAATIETEAKRIRANRRGEWFVHPDFWPVLQVLSFSVGTGMSDQVALSLANVLVEPHCFTVLTPGFTAVTPQGPLEFGTVAPGSLAWVNYSYVTGWPVTSLSAGATLGASSLQVVSATGIFAGTQLGIYDSESVEFVTVANSYVSGTTLPLTATLAAAHASGVAVSALPDAIKQATISLTACLIKLRGSRADVMASVPGENPTRAALFQAGALEDFDLADALLEPFHQVAVM